MKQSRQTESRIAKSMTHPTSILLSLAVVIVSAAVAGESSADQPVSATKMYEKWRASQPRSFRNAEPATATGSQREWVIVPDYRPPTPAARRLSRIAAGSRYVPGSAYVPRSPGSSSQAMRNLLIRELSDYGVRSPYRSFIPGINYGVRSPRADFIPGINYGVRSTVPGLRRP